MKILALFLISVLFWTSTNARRILKEDSNDMMDGRRLANNMEDFDEEQDFDDNTDDEGDQNAKDIIIERLMENDDNDDEEEEEDSKDMMVESLPRNDEPVENFDDKQEAIEPNDNDREVDEDSKDTVVESLPKNDEPVENFDDEQEAMESDENEKEVDEDSEDTMLERLPKNYEPVENFDDEQEAMEPSDNDLEVEEDEKEIVEDEDDINDDNTQNDPPTVLCKDVTTCTQHSHCLKRGSWWSCLKWLKWQVCTTCEGYNYGANCRTRNCQTSGNQYLEPCPTLPKISGAVIEFCVYSYVEADGYCSNVQCTPLGRR